MKRKVMISTAAVVAAGVAGTVAIRSGGAESPAVPPVTATAQVLRGDLIDSATVDGRLTYASERKLVAAGRGVLTSVPAAGGTVRQGKALWRVNRAPVVLLYGSVPLYRTLTLGISDGPDVSQLEKSLHALGHGDGLTLDDHFSASTAAAIRHWQKSVGLEQTGQIDASQVVFLPSRVRVLGAELTVGDQVSAGTPVLTVSATGRVVRIDLEVGSATPARKGQKVIVEVPGGRRLPGWITSVGTVARQKSATAAPTVEVDITVTGATGALDRAPVTVTLESSHRRNVLTVPVEALLAIREGGFAVEVVDPGGSRIVPVTTGAYGGGRVEISGPAVTAGLKVGIPSR